MGAQIGHFLNVLLYVAIFNMWTNPSRGLSILLVEAHPMSLTHVEDLIENVEDLIEKKVAMWIT